MRELLKNKLLWIGSLGYFVDLFDLVLFGTLRVQSLKSLGYSGSELVSAGTALLNFQMIGMLAGGILWGVLGDRVGRRAPLIGSILLYSTATFLNGSVHHFSEYAILRFVAGFGLAGEFGAAITLITESISSKLRGLATALLSSIGCLGAISASFASQFLSWENAYRLGGFFGILLLLSRMRFQESELFLRLKHKHTSHSVTDFVRSLLSPGTLKKFILLLLGGVPVWYVAGVLCYFSPELGRELRLSGEVTAGNTIIVTYLGAVFGNPISGIFSEFLQSRKQAVLTFMCACGLLALLGPLLLKDLPVDAFYAMMAGVGFATGYSSIWVTGVTETFGTNIRATLNSAIPNLTRASVIPILFFFSILNRHFGMLKAVLSIGFVCFSLGFFALILVPDTFRKEMDFLTPG